MNNRDVEPLKPLPLGKNHYDFPTVISGMEIPVPGVGPIPAPPRPSRSRRPSPTRDMRLVALRLKRRTHALPCTETNQVIHYRRKNNG